MAYLPLVGIPTVAPPVGPPQLPPEISAIQDFIQSGLPQIYQPIVQGISTVAADLGITTSQFAQPTVPVGVPLQLPGTIGPPLPQNYPPAPADYGNGYSSTDINAMLTAVQNANAVQQGINSAQLSQLYNTVQQLISGVQREIASDSQNIMANIINPIQREVSDIGAAINSVVGPIADQFNTVLSSIMGTAAAARDTASETLVREAERSSEEIAVISRQASDTLYEAITEQTAGLHELSTAAESFERRFTTGEKIPVVVSFQDIRGDTENVLAGTGETLHDKQSSVQDFLKGVLSTIFPGLRPTFQLLGGELPIDLPNFARAWEKFEKGEYKDLDAFIDGVGQGAIGSEFLKIVFGVVALLSAATNTAFGMGKPIANGLEQLAWGNNPTRLNDISTYITYLFRFPQAEQYVRETLGKHGLSSTEIDTLIDSARSVMPLDAARQLWLRGEIEETEHDQILGALGYDEHAILGLKTLYQFIPAAPDLTRIADKRIWGLITDAKYGQYAEKPHEYEEFMAQLGYSKQWTDWFWASHWNLPSPQQVFEMFHRRKIDQHDMDTYLGLTDWLPFFRDKLREISYSVLTRVDIRRMWKLGLLTPQRLHEAHLDLGYTEEDAVLLDKFVQETQLPEDDTEIDHLRRRARTAVETAYRNGKLSRQDAQKRLATLGTLPAHIDELLNIVDLERPEIAHADRALKQVEKAINLVEKQYVAGHIPRHDAYNKLINLGFSQSQADVELSYLDLEYDIEQKEKIVKHAENLYISHQIEGDGLVALLSGQGFTLNEVNEIAAYLNIQRQHKDKRPGEKEIQKFYALGIIDRNTFYNEMRGYGYADKYIEWYALEIAKSLT